MKNFKKMGMVVLGSAIVFAGSNMVFSEPGTSKDPLISKSYVDNKIEQLKVYIDEKIGSGGKTGGVSGSSESFEVVEVKSGQSIILGEGAELILRSGVALSISRVENGEDNGLCDVTTGVDLVTDQQVQKNHLLISPRNDGRGVVAAIDSFFMVKGAYEIR